MTAGIPPTRNDHMRGQRDTVTGWTDRSTRSNTRFLYSVDERELDGFGFALSLTVKDCPVTADHWHKARRAFLKRMGRMGMLRGHWLTEWQRRGVPHMHAAIWFPKGEIHPLKLRPEIVRHWCDVAEPYGAAPRGQSVTAINNAVGWFQYLSKHAVRGLSHYQRSSDNIPAGWAVTGRMWGHVGDWPVRDAVAFRLDFLGFVAYRRIVRGWRKADARASGERGRVRAARAMLKCHSRELSSVRGVSEWFPQRLNDAAMINLATRGYSVKC